ncbi:MAG: dipeptide/oligopeptide/nickel ABC transporter permease/ATP-binding protein [Treponema sp.]|jgi:peptide/nickel transport system permease protein|nr:dipeptide/oligopeptide/nickel ABC transporter permease/ATP-binding protein [Treponema sp.]
MKRFAKYLKNRPIGMISLVLLFLLYFMMIFAEFFAPYSPNTSFPDKSYHPPNVRFYRGKLQVQEFRVTNTVTWKYARVRDVYSPLEFFGKGETYRLWGLFPAQRHLIVSSSLSRPVFLMGTDSLGRDLFSRIVHGSRISLTIGFVATFLSLALAVLFGGLSGYYGGLTDWSIMRFSEFLMLIPSLYLILFLRSLMASTMDTGQSYMMITVILSLVGWPGSARTIRGMVHAIKREEFVLNAQLEMIPSVLIILNHIIPQIASLLIVSIALSIPGFIMTETVLSYLGLGITDPAVSWGSLIKRDISTLTNLQAYPWLLNPVWFLLGVTLAFNFLGDALRDFYDPYHTVFARRKGSRIRELITRIRERRTMSNEQGAMRNEQGTENIVSNHSLLTSRGEPSPYGLGRGTHKASEPENCSLFIAHCSLLKITDLQVSFTILRGNKLSSILAVRGLSLTLNKGECLGIVGESGSGKSVSTQAIPGLLPKNASISGSILYEGKEMIGLDIEALREYRGKKIGMIFQEPGRSYDPLQNMGSVFFETFKNSEPGITKEKAFEKAAALLAETGLENGRERLGNFPHQFSGGQLQRIGIALALAQGCELLIADEPTTALDVTIQKQIVELLKTLRRSRGISIIFISHDIDLVADISDRIMVMYGGMEMELGPSETIISNPKHPYTRALLASSPRFGSHYSLGRLSAIPGKVSDPGTELTGCPFAPRCSQAAEKCHETTPPLVEIEGHEVGCSQSRSD